MRWCLWTQVHVSAVTLALWTQVHVSDLWTDIINCHPCAFINSFANQFILHWNMLQAQSTFTWKDHAQTKLATKAQALTEQVIMMSTSVQTTALTKQKLQCTYWNNCSCSSPSSQFAPFPPSLLLNSSFSFSSCTIICLSSPFSSWIL